MGIDIVVVNYKRYDLTKKFLDTFYKFEPSSDYTLTVADNETEEKSANFLREYYPQLRVLSTEKNLGYAGACNWGASMGDSKYIGIFNNDIEFVNNTCIDQMVNYMDKNPDVGVTGPFQFSNTNGKKMITHAGIVGTNTQPQHRGWRQTNFADYRFNDEVLTVSGSAMVVRRSFWEAVRDDAIFQKHNPGALGGMPDSHVIYFEETLLNYLAPHFGYKVVYMGEPGCEVIHQWHQTIKPEHEHYFQDSQKKFRATLDDYGIAHD